MADICPICGKGELTRRRGTYHFAVPDDGSNPDAKEFEVDVENAEWEECTECGEVLLLPELDNEIERWQYRREGLLIPEEIKAIRKRFGLTQAEIAKLIGVGEKSYARWENGLSMQSKANDNLIRLFEKRWEEFLHLESDRLPYSQIKTRVMQHLDCLEEDSFNGDYEIAAHGGFKSIKNLKVIGDYLKSILESEGQDE